MDKIKLLGIKKLIRELEYVESDFEYRSEIVSEADSKFLEDVNKFLDNHPDLKELYENRITERLNKSVKSTDVQVFEESETVSDDNTNDSTNDNIPESLETENKQEEKSTKIKKLYREIVKITHPDKSKQKGHSEIYVKATEYYELNDKIGIYKICNELNIDYDIDTDDNSDIELRIEKIKSKIAFLESTFTYQWVNCNNEVEKNNMLISFIRMRLQ